MATTSPTDTPFPTSSVDTLGTGTNNGTTSGVASPRSNSDVLNRVVQGAHHAIDRIAESAAPHVERLEQGYSTASQSLHTRSDQMREVGDEWAESLRATVREHPLAAVATALAVGLLVAKITH